MKQFIAGLVLVGLLLPASVLGQDAPQPPSVAWGALYGAVEMASLFPDQKTFADATPRKPAARIRADYQRQKELPGFSLRAFVMANFTLPDARNEPVRRHPGQDVRAYIRQTWESLRRPPDKRGADGSLLPLSHPYIVPGGRFREI